MRFGPCSSGPNAHTERAANRSLWRCGSGVLEVCSWCVSGVLGGGVNSVLEVCWKCVSSVLGAYYWCVRICSVLGYLG